MVLGDMNDFDGSPLATQASGIPPVTTVLEVLRNASDFGQLRQSAGAVRLRSILELVPQEQRFSEWWDQDGDCADGGVSADPKRNEKSMLDHLLLSDDGLWASVVQGSAHVYNSDWSPACLRDGGLYSDHWPLSVVINTTSAVLATTAADGRRDGSNGCAPVAASRDAAAVSAAVLGVLLVAAVALSPRIAPAVDAACSRAAAARGGSRLRFARALGAEEEDEDDSKGSGIAMGALRTSQSSSTATSDNEQGEVEGGPVPATGMQSEKKNIKKKNRGGLVVGSRDGLVDLI